MSLFIGLKFVKVKFLLPCFFFNLFFFQLSFSQTISGIVSNEKGEKIENVYVSIRKASSPDIISQYAITADNGLYEIDLKSPLDSIVVYVSAIDHEPQQKYLFNVRDRRKHTVDFHLAERTTELKEVIIEHKQPVVVRNDTVTYDPNAFKDGTERVIEDLLKKLPGIKVGENGEIKYKGKSIKKFLVDGDDLFDSEYTIGSRNINVEMVEQVQAVENFIDNPLLKDLIESDDAALNIVLKKGKTDLSGNAELGYGIKDKYDASVTGLAINSQIKGFGIASYNNIGDNPTPYDFSSDIVSVGQNADKRYLSPQLLRQGNFYSELEDKYHRINDNLYINSNFLYKFSSKTKFRVGFGFYDDRLKRTNVSRSEYSVNNESFVVNEVEKINKEPRLYNGNLQILHKLSDSQTLEYLGKINYEDINYFSNSVNNEFLQSNFINTANFFTKHNLNYTKRLNENSAFISTAQYSKSRAPQRFLLTPGIVLNEQSDIVQSDQSSKFDKDYITADAEYYANLEENIRWQFGAGYRQSRTNFGSRLLGVNAGNETVNYPNFQNDVKYNVSVPYLSTGFGYSENKFYAGASVSAQYFHFMRSDNYASARTTENELLFVPNLNLKYKFSKKSGLTASYSYSQTAPREENMLEGIVMTNYRNFINNEIDIRFLKTHTYILGYRFNDFYKLTSFNVLFSHNVRKNNYSFKTTLDPYVSTYTSFLLDAAMRDYGININAEKYIHLIRTTWQLNASYSVAQSKNVVNQSDLRDIQSHVAFLDLTGRTGLRGAVNFENKTSLMHVTSYAEGSPANDYSALTNSFKAILKIGQNLKANASLSYISPDTSIDNNYWFLDSEVKLTSKNKKINYSLIARNLTNNKEFTTIFVSDYSRAMSSHNLIQRFLLLKIGFTF